MVALALSPLDAVKIVLEGKAVEVFMRHHA